MQPATLEALAYAKDIWKNEKDGPLVTMDAGANVHFIWRNDQGPMAKQAFAALGSRFAFHGNRPELWQRVTL